MKEYRGGLKVYFVLETAQAERRSKRVYAPACDERDGHGAGQLVAAHVQVPQPPHRAAHSSTFQLEVSTCRGIRCALGGLSLDTLRVRCFEWCRVQSLGFRV